MPPSTPLAQPCQFTEVAGDVYPEEYEAFLAKLAVINLEIGSILSNSCIITTGVYDSLLLATVGPVVVLLVLFGTLFNARRRNTRTEADEPILRINRESIGLFVLFFVYSSVSYTIFSDICLRSSGRWHVLPSGGLQHCMLYCKARRVQGLRRRHGIRLSSRYSGVVRLVAGAQSS